MISGGGTYRASSSTSSVDVSFASWPQPKFFDPAPISSLCKGSQARKHSCANSGKSQIDLAGQRRPASIGSSGDVDSRSLGIRLDPRMLLFPLTSSINDTNPVEEWGLPHTSNGSHQNRTQYASSESSSTASQSFATSHTEHRSPSSEPTACSAPSSLKSPQQRSLAAYGLPAPTTDTSAAQMWRCAYPGCTSKMIFSRGCDLRKHFKRHSRHLFCRIEGCLQSDIGATAQAEGCSSGSPHKLGFSNARDRARHEAKHSPAIVCEWKNSDLMAMSLLDLTLMSRLDLMSIPRASRSTSRLDLTPTSRLDLTPTSLLDFTLMSRLDFTSMPRTSRSMSRLDLASTPTA